MKKLIQQILKFGVVGFLCFFIDYGIMVALTELCGISSVISSGISFSVSVIVNYILSITVVFDAQYYSDNNPDLREIYGDDLPSYYNHYMDCGWAEERICH